jgi:hypothetical protein
MLRRQKVLILEAFQDSGIVDYYRDSALILDGSKTTEKPAELVN